ncbi:MAG: hypothetical protein AAF656_02390 [Planctomycetota bacterium]
MTEPADPASRRGAFGASRAAATLLVLFVPSHQRDGTEADQDRWVEETLRALGTLLGGATAYPKGRGVWRDDDQGGALLFDTPVVVQCYTSEDVLLEKADALREFLVRMGREMRQGSIGFVIDNEFLEIRFDQQGEPIEP